LKLLYMLERLQRQAAAAGGALWVLNGNHETMNVGGNFRYATKGVPGSVSFFSRHDCLAGVSSRSASLTLSALLLSSCQAHIGITALPPGFVWGQGNNNVCRCTPPRTVHAGYQHVMVSFPLQVPT
jgi:hypothetical protein